MARVAFLTYGLLLGPWGSETVQGFQDRIPDVFGAAARQIGFVDTVRADDPTVARWGEASDPPFYTADEAGRIAQTLSLWEDLESVFAFAYNGAHGEAMGHRREWFIKHTAPTYVAWWVPDDHQPTWQEAYSRLRALETNGSTAAAFDFKQSFTADGMPAKVDREQVGLRVTLTQYLTAWTHPDPEVRRTALAACWAEGATYTDPLAHAEGAEALAAVIDQFLAQAPGTRFTLEGKIAAHHSSLRFFWTMHLPGGATVAGMDYGERDADGKLTKIVGFF